MAIEAEHRRHRLSRRGLLWSFIGALAITLAGPLSVHVIPLPGNTDLYAALGLPVLSMLGILGLEPSLSLFVAALVLGIALWTLVLYGASRALSRQWRKPPWRFGAGKGGA
jgi:hypothetical protein